MCLFYIEIDIKKIKRLKKKLIPINVNVTSLILSRGGAQRPHIDCRHGNVTPLKKKINIANNLSQLYLPAELTLITHWPLMILYLSLNIGK